MFRRRSMLFVYLLPLLALRGSSRSAHVDPQQPKQLGLYDASDRGLLVLVAANLSAAVERRPRTASVVEFYNSWCGHCRRFAPEWKAFAAGARGWAAAVRVGAIDCADELNTGACRDYEIMAYPTIRFFPEGYVFGPKSLGDGIVAANAQQCISGLVARLIREQDEGRGRSWPPLAAQNFTSASDGWNLAPSRVSHLIYIFARPESTLGPEIALDLMNATRVRVWSVAETAKLYRDLVGRMTSPLAFISDGPSYNPREISNKETRAEMLSDIVEYLTQQGVEVPKLDDTSEPVQTKSDGHGQFINFTAKKLVGKTVFQSDLDAGMRYSLVHEIPAKKEIVGDSLAALKLYLDVLVKHFPAKGNTKAFLVELNEVVAREHAMTGAQFADLVRELETRFAPVYASSMQWVGCKGSEPRYRGFTCSLWSLFHVLTASETSDRDVDDGDSKALSSMLGYVKFFFGCTDCSTHFQEMVQRHPFDSFQGADRYDRWLWFAHNQVNLRLAKDSTEDPAYPKRQFPYEEHCPDCRLGNGNWDEDKVMVFYRNMYASENVHHIESTIHRSSSTSAIPSFEKTVMGVLYVYCIIALVLIMRLFFVKGSYRKKAYVHDTYGKV